MSANDCDGFGDFDNDSVEQLSVEGVASHTGRHAIRRQPIWGGLSDLFCPNWVFQVLFYNTGFHFMRSRFNLFKFYQKKIKEKKLHNFYLLFGV